MARIGGRDEVDAYVGARIGLRRSALGLSQSALAQQLGISFQQVQKYETGQNRISASRLHRAATVLGTSVETFFPPVETARGAADAGWEALRFITATADGRTVAAGFPLIEDRDLRRAVARIVRALARDA
ncbi:MAG: helix-turn-helix domain-containing protein [Alphaproteobacteria bacterium]|jgi:transcriptional regulator with XRE-family HTH domain|uniref:helix-turn-helix domain-containing protein n=1 Tax=Brevundimonas sp. TaxID=1871086 RepID=UPI00121E0249|nr:helix-turn-helix transcriptional regulator [Brevundimonas sp.]MBU3971569.1 helix-turn-helix domain-containing protein [Alphaproteobacteria bacterium]MBA3051156.1 helix-turn-helix transcriptional regulator [Brevundimonas sp.]MBU3974698.1 helix-turn-helix domain-containing protein [Alphaproteobacteria bacterium]MBU4040462.1 helix-turn-helix domain-containing protein [Alphaproteobacteria bacterium]MBU4138147.1 helix-turn-helix domain-containing protein [Alphaproteobacteria bacterium]